MLKNSANTTTALHPQTSDPGHSSREPRQLESDPAYRALLVAVWNRNEGTILARAKSLKASASSLVEGMINVQLAEKAESDAHKLSGCLGSFGLDEASRIAQEIERILRSANWMNRESRLHIVELSDSLEENILMHRPRE